MNYYNLAEACAVSKVRKDMELDEATYYGRNAELIKCEGYLQNIMNLIRKEGSGAYYGPKVQSNFRNLEDSFQKLFGFEEVSINSSSSLFLAMNGMAGNAFTVMRGKMFMMERVTLQNGEVAKVVQIDKNHRATKVKNGRGWILRICISYTLFCDYGEYTLTARELLAVLLHEIGHNFYGDVGRMTLDSIIDLLAVMTIPEIDMMTRALIFAYQFTAMDMINAVFDAIDAIPGMKQAMATLVNSFEVGYGAIWQIITPIRGIYNFIILVWAISMGYSLYSARQVMTLLNPLSWFRSFINYDQEKYADAFAAAYGYGPDQASALQKLSSEYYLFPSTKEYNQMVQYMCSAIFACTKMMFLPFYALDVHPSNAARQKNMLTYLEQVEVKKLPPELRKEYLAELKRAQNQRLDTKNYQGYDVTMRWDKIEATIQDIIHLSDIRDLTSTIGRWGKYENLDFD